jgi:drug/metabolite transporter (DMT)-like permease
MHSTTKLALLTFVSALLSVTIKTLTLSMEPFVQMAVRSLAVAVIGSLWLRGRFEWTAVREQVGLYVARSFLLTLLGGGLFIFAMHHCKVGVVAFLVCLPFEALWGWILFQERLKGQHWVGYAAALVGLWMLCDIDLMGKNWSVDSSYATGVVCATLSGISWGLGIALGRYQSVRVSNAEISILHMWLGAFWSIGAALVSGESWSFSLSASSWFVLVASCLLVGGYSVLLHGASREVSMNQLAMSALLQPALAAAFAYLFLGEAFTHRELLGSVWILGGVVFSSMDWRWSPKSL